MPKGYRIVHADVTDAAGYDACVEAAAPPVERFGGRFLVAGGASEAPEAAGRASHVVIEFPDVQAAGDCYRSDDYQAVPPMRRRSADSGIVMVERT